jgi:hypothetical protein
MSTNTGSVSWKKGVGWNWSVGEGIHIIMCEMGPKTVSGIQLSKGHASKKRARRARGRLCLLFVSKNFYTCVVGIEPPFPCPSRIHNMLIPRPNGKTSRQSEKSFLFGLVTQTLQYTHIQQTNYFTKGSVSASQVRDAKKRSFWLKSALVCIITVHQLFVVTINIHLFLYFI